MNHIFYMKFDTSMTDEEKDLFLQCLPTARKERVLRLKGRESSIKCLQTGLFLRYCLNMCGIEHTTEDILVAEGGKPYMKNHQVFFNISHSDDYVVIMIADHNCGIDLQQRIVYKERLAKKIMHENEYKIISSSPDNDKEDLLTLCWSGKEAYLKYTGSGIRYAMSYVDLSNLLRSFGQDAGCIEIVPESNSLFMRYYLFEKDYCLAVCQKDYFVQQIIEKVEINQVYSSMKSLYL